MKTQPKCPTKDYAALSCCLIFSVSGDQPKVELLVDDVSIYRSFGSKESQLLTFSETAFQILANTFIYQVVMKTNQ